MKYIESAAYILALLSVIVFFHYPEIAPYLLALGAAGLCITRWRERYEGTNLRLRRIIRIRHFIGVIWLIASYYMFKPGNYWLVAIMIAVILEFYSLWVIEYTRKKEARKGGNIELNTTNAKKKTAKRK